MKKKYIFLLVVICQIIVLILMAMSKQTILNNGSTIILQITPVDPHDMFRGDYISLRYNISELDQQIFSEEIKKTHYTTKRPVYVYLKQNKSTFVPYKVSFKKSDNSIFIKGFIKQNNWWQFKNSIPMYYGLDSFFVPERTGEKWENIAQNQNLYAEIKVDKNGNAIISKLIKK